MTINPTSTLLTATVFTTAAYNLLTLLNTDTYELSLTSCASPFALFKKSRFVALLVQPFLIRDFSDLVAFTLTLYAIHSTSSAVHSMETRKNSQLHIFTSTALDSSDFEQDDAFIPSPTSSIFTAFPQTSTQLSQSGLSFPLFLLSYFAFIAFRLLLGYLFFIGTGFAAPKWFFHSSYYDCCAGIHPIYLIYTIFVGYFKIMRKELFVGSITVSPRDMRQLHWLIWRDLKQQLILILMAFFFTNALVWTVLSSLLAALIMCFFGSLYYVLRSRSDRFRKFSAFMYSTAFLILCTVAMLLVTVISKLLRDALMPLPETIDFSIMNNWYSSFQSLITVTIVTAPRPNNPNFLWQTVDSFLDVYPKTPSDPLFDRFNILVSTEFLHDEHLQFRAAMEHYAQTRVLFTRRGEYVGRENDNIPDTRPTQRQQSLHFSSALKAALRTDSAFVLLMEDDFPLCEKGWQKFLKILYRTYSPQSLPPLTPALSTNDSFWTGPCGIFIGTGGSGLLIRRDIIPILITLLTSDLVIFSPTDIIIQDCLRGRIPQCLKCMEPGNNFVASSRLLMRHLGFNSSTYRNRKYTPEQWQCGWRHPFNGEPDIRVVLED